MRARRIEREIDLGQTPAPDLIDLHIADMVEVGKEIGRSKGSVSICCAQGSGI
ncbi:hypothetical protein [Mesorhizobium sp. CAU 1732]|uniref:hypothetical protein n=1 Tax=Mesorhizobium sp. CAU 1732 TaxID=3140358 RepID=UPI003260421E